MGLIDDEEINFKKQLKSLIEMADQFSKFKTNDSNDGNSSINSEMSVNEEIKEDEEIVQNEEFDEEVVTNNISNETVVNEENQINNVSNEEIINNNENEVQDDITLKEDNASIFNLSDETMNVDNSEKGETPINDAIEVENKENSNEIETLDDFIS